MQIEPSQNKPTILMGGIALILTGVLYPVVFTFLAIRFNYPDVLDGDANEVLPKLLAGGSLFRFTWAIYGLLPLLLIPAGTGAFYAFRKDMEGGMRVALHLSILAAFSLMIGLLRWSSIHWELAKFYTHADVAQRETVNAIFLGLNSYLGNYIGEFIGEGLMHGFLLLTAVGMVRTSGFPKWMAWIGIVISSMSLFAVFRNFNSLADSVQNLLNTLMLFPIWLVLLGIGLVRFSKSLQHHSSKKDLV
jgi:Domain of unknown function (DUF4386)